MAVRPDVALLPDLSEAEGAERGHPAEIQEGAEAVGYRHRRRRGKGPRGRRGLLLMLEIIISQSAVQYFERYLCAAASD